MDLGIAGRRALVIGGSRGMGRATAHRFAAEGCIVTIVGRTPETLETAAREIGADTGSTIATVVADITSDAGRDAVLAALPDPDILINNGDGEPPGDFRDWRPADWYRAIDRMMLAPIEMIRRTVDGMAERGFGRVVNIVARSVKIAQSDLGLSNGARSGLVGFSAGVAREMIRHGVTINNVLPGIVASDAQKHHVRKLAEQTGRPFEDIWAERQRANPAGRYGRPEEVAALIAYFASAHAGFVTGQSVLIDGGQYPGTY